MLFINYVTLKRVRDLVVILVLNTTENCDKGTRIKKPTMNKLNLKHDRNVVH